MADNEQPFYIVLVNKALTGPFSLPEIEALLEQEQIRLGDIGYQIRPDPKKGEWRFLWQILNVDPPEITKVTSLTEMAKQSSTPRDVIPEAKIKLAQEVLEKISLDDWVPRAQSHSRSHSERLAELAAESEERDGRREPAPVYSHTPMPRKKEWFFGTTAAIAALMSVTFLKSRLKWPAPEPTASVQAPPPEASLPSAALKSGTPLQWTSGRGPAAAPGARPDSGPHGHAPAGEGLPKIRDDVGNVPAGYTPKEDDERTREEEAFEEKKDSENPPPEDDTLVKPKTKNVKNQPPESDPEADAEGNERGNGEPSPASVDE